MCQRGEFDEPLLASTSHQRPSSTALGHSDSIIANGVYSEPVAKQSSVWTMAADAFVRRQTGSISHKYSSLSKWRQPRFAARAGLNGAERAGFAIRRRRQANRTALGRSLAPKLERRHATVCQALVVRSYERCTSLIRVIANDCNYSFGQMPYRVFACSASKWLIAASCPAPCSSRQSDPPLPLLSLTIPRCRRSLSAPRCPGP